MAKVKLGIIGVGNMGTGHSKNYLDGLMPEIEITAVADRNPARREWAKENLPGVKVFEEGVDLIHSGACEAVLIATPHYQHPPLAIEAFKNGLHVMVEKPAGVYTLQVREMNAEADRHPELTFGMMFNQRTNCTYRKMHELIHSGAIGDLKRVNWIITDWYRTQFYYDSGAWRATWAGEGGGVLLNQCPHQLDLLQWLCGLPVRVRAACHEGKWHDIEVEDDVTAYLEFANGATGTFIASTGDALGENRLEIIGTRARIRIENDQLTLDTLSVDERDWCPVCKEPFGVPDIQHEIVQTDGENPQHAGVLNAFAAHILHGTPLVADGREGIRGLMLSNAMHLSSWTNQTVSLPIDEELFLKLLNEKRRTSRHKDEVDAAIDVSGSFGSTRK
mgnify:FL=1